MKSPNHITEGTTELSVLIVDDNPINLLYLKRLLTRNGVQVWDAIDIQSAIQLLNDQVVQLVITDIHLPGESGWSLLEFVRKSPAHIGVQVYSTTASFDLPTSEGEYTFDGHLGKPVQEDDLLLLVRNYSFSL